MRTPIKKGLSFGLTSSIITILALLVGLEAGTGSRSAVIAGILVIAFADSCSDALAMHLSEESTNKKQKEVWEVTFATFGAKLFFALTFVVPVLLFSTNIAVLASIIWAVLLLSLLSFWIARQQDERPARVILEHLFIMSLVVLASYFIGLGVGSLLS